jgi:hypothetical protein
MLALFTILANRSPSGWAGFWITANWQLSVARSSGA